MNIEAYDADSLRKMVRLLEYENKILKDKLKKAGISYEEVNPFEEKIESAEEYDLDQGNRIVNPPYITEKMAITFLFGCLGKRRCSMPEEERTGAIFHNVRIVGMTGFALNNVKRRCFVMKCENTKWISLDVKKIIAHLLGTKRRRIRCNRCISFIVKWYMQIYCI